MRESSTKSFNAVPPIRRGGSGGRKRAIVAAMLAVAVAIAVFATLIILEVADCGGDKKKNDDILKNSVFENVSFENKLYASSDIHKGDLILINSSFPYVFPSEPAVFVNCYNPFQIIIFPISTLS